MRIAAALDAIDSAMLATVFAASCAPDIKPHLREQGLEWAYVLPVLETIDSVAELKAALAEPKAFLERLADASTPTARTTCGPSSRR